MSKHHGDGMGMFVLFFGLTVIMAIVMYCWLEGIGVSV